MTETKNTPKKRVTVKELDQRISVLEQKKRNWYFGEWYIFIGLIVGSFIFGYAISQKYSVPQVPNVPNVPTVTSKDSELQKIVKKIPATDRQKLADCIDKAIESDADEAHELRENLHDNIKLTFDDAEETIWQPFRIWIVGTKTIDSYESAKKVYETIKTVLKQEVKESW